jgi:ribonuclease M5
MKYGFVVEGFHDETKVLRLLPNSAVVVLSSKFGNKAKMDLDKALSECDEVFVLTDPDDFGDTLASWVLRDYPNLRRITLEREKCFYYLPNKVKVGVEHCTNEYLMSVLAPYLSFTV